MPTLIGNKLIGRFEILSLISQGGITDVYRALDIDLHREVAVKILAEKYASQPRMLSRFEREARTMASLEHDNILPVYDVAFDKELSRSYMITPFISGGTLRDRIGIPMDLRQVVDFTRMIASGLVHAHQRGVCHLDIKPSNLLVSPGHKIFITDFGLAQVLEERDAKSHEISGTPAYMSPERCRKEPGDYRSDIYSLGIVIYEMIAGNLPYYGESASEIIKKHIKGDIPKINQINTDVVVPPKVEKVIFKALSMDPADRWETAQDLANQLYYEVQQSYAENYHRSGNAAVVDFTKQSNPKELVDRIEEWQILTKRLESLARKSPTGSQVYIFTGITGIGKSFLLEALEKYCADLNIHKAYVNMEEVRARENDADTDNISVIEIIMSQLNRTSKIARELAKGISEYRADANFDPNQSGLKNRYQRIQDDFIFFLREILSDEPIVLIFDRSELMSRQVQDLLKDIFNKQFNQNLTILIAGRHKLDLKLGQVQKSFDLSLFKEGDTIEHWNLISPKPEFQGKGRLIHKNFSRGHPISTVRVANTLNAYTQRSAMVSDPDSTLRELRPVIVANLTVSMLYDLLGKSDDYKEDEEYVRTLAPLRLFNEQTAIDVLKENSPDLLPPDNETLSVKRQLNSLVNVVFRKEQPTWMYQMEPVLRRFILDDLLYNNPIKYRRLHAAALRASLAQIKDSELADFCYLVPEVLYHQAVLETDASSQPQKEVISFSDSLQDKLISKLKELVTDYRMRDDQKYSEMTTRLSAILQDDHDLKEIIGDDCIKALTECLMEMESVDPITKPPIATEILEEVPKPTESNAMPIYDSGEQLPSDRRMITALRVLIGIVVLVVVILLIIAEIVNRADPGKIPWLVGLGLFVITLLVVVFLALTGILGRNEVSDLLQNLILKIQLPFTRKVSEHKITKTRDTLPKSKDDESGNHV